MNKIICGLAMSLLAGIVNAATPNWDPIGDSSAGKHYVDIASVDWQAGKTAFTVDTRVVLNNDSTWLTTLQVDCKEGTYAYLKGKKMQGGNVVSQFDTPKPPSGILQDSMPDQIRRSFCGIRTVSGQWESIGKSNISEVFFNRASVKQYADGSHFMADTRVVPFDKSQETFSTLSFNCDASTFTMMKMSTLKDGKLKQVFDKPKPATPVSKTATLDTLAHKFCVDVPIVNDWQELDLGGSNRLYISDQSVQWNPNHSFFSILIKSEYEQGTEMTNNVSIDCEKNNMTFLGGTLKSNGIMENLGAEPPKFIVNNTPFAKIRGLYCGQ